MQVSFVYHNCLGPFNFGALLQISILFVLRGQPQDMDKKKQGRRDPAETGGGEVFINGRTGG
jgi:hypothetical protein